MKGSKCISASMICADLKNLEKTIRIFEGKKIDYLHIDVMDGRFVPNMGLGIDYIRNLMEITDIPFDIHLMTNRPEEKIEWMRLRKEDIISIHYESTSHIQRAIDKAHKYDCKVFLAINPGTPIYSLEELLNDIDGINVLMVNPGFTRQKIILHCMDKMHRIKNMLKKMGRENIKIEVDGNISFENARILSELGAEIFVAGTSSIFSGNIIDIERNIDKMRQSIK